MYEDLKEKLNEFVKGRVKPTRYKHTLGVVETASKMAEQFGVDKDKAEVAALFHDAYREKGNLEHGPYAADKLQEKFGVTDPDILNAVRWHTTGRPGMSKLEQVVYISDSIEPSRDYPMADFLRSHMTGDLDQNTYFLMKHTREYVLSIGGSFADISNQAIAAYEEKFRSNMESREMALLCAKCLDLKKASDVVLINIAERSSFADYFVIATAGSLRQMESLEFELEYAMAKEGLELRHCEGKGESGWILMDYGDLIVNIFTAEQRNKYQIEKIWNDCPSEEYKGEE